MVREITRQPAIASYIAEESVPGPAVNSDADIIDFCRQRGRSCLHPLRHNSYIIQPNAEH